MNEKNEACDGKVLICLQRAYELTDRLLIRVTSFNVVCIRYLA